MKIRPLFLREKCQKNIWDMEQAAHRLAKEWGIDPEEVKPFLGPGLNGNEQVTSRRAKKRKVGPRDANVFFSPDSYEK